MNAKRQARIITRASRLHYRGQVGEALQLYARVLDVNPKHPVALHQAALATRQLADVAQARGEPFDRDTARRFMEGAIESVAETFRDLGDRPVSGGIAHDCATIIHNYAKFLTDFGTLEDRRAVIPCYEAALTLDPTLGESWTNLGNAYGDVGNRERAEAAWNMALRCPNPTPEARFNVSMLHLLRGDYETGWPMYEARWDSVTFRSSYWRSDIDSPLWDGAPVGTLYVHGEQGAGDIIQMARWLPWARERCDRLIVEVFRSIVELFRATFPWCEVVGRGDDAPTHDANLPMMSFPAVFGATLANLPEPAPFRLGTAGTPVISGRIGVCWKGSPTHPNDRMRSMRAEDMIDPLVGVPGVSLQSLQYGEEPTGIRPMPRGDYLETARTIASCERVVTVDTSVAHLAASMGTPTLLCLPVNGEWRWLQDRSDSPWYPSITIIRQRAPGDWADVMARVREALCTNR